MHDQSKIVKCAERKRELQFKLKLFCV